MSKFVVMGYPVAHSLSPFIHLEFAKQCNIQLEYSYLEVQANGLAEQINSFVLQGGQGINLTAPLKQSAFTVVQKLTERAKLAQAINTIVVQPDGLLGDNTDGIGLMRDLSLRHQFSLQKKHVLILGAGGATRGILGSLLEEGPASITLVNRNKDQANIIRDQWLAINANICSLQVLDYTELENDCKYDLILNATSAWQSKQIPNVPEKFNFAGAFCYDLNYLETRQFLAYAQKKGARKIADGLGMLVEQAAESFYLWHNLRCNTNLVLSKLHAITEQKIS